MPSNRQLAAIMFADIAGYTALMQEDESLALHFRQRFQSKLEEVTKARGGRILEFRGDGALCYFTSTIECILASLALQQEMQVSPVVPLRIGIHTGDVLLDGNSIYGDGVNIASRMESFAVPGSIFISGKTYDDIKNQKEISAITLGKYKLKNVKEPVEIFAISNKGIVVPLASALEGKGEAARQNYILVLPFVNISKDPEQEYFSDGLTEELISGISRLKNVKVISRTTSMKYKQTDKDLKTIGKETGACFIMEGSVRQAGNNLRITAQFIDAVHDVHLWTETFRGTMDDIFDIQENVSSRIVKALHLQLTRDEKDFLQKRYTENSEAYQLYLQGRYFWNKRNEQGFRSAIKYFEKALEIDPGFALAWTGISDTYSLMAEYTNVSRRDILPIQMNAANMALKIDPDLAEAHISLAISLMMNNWDWINSEKQFLRGIELNPNYATGHHWYAQLLLYSGRTEDALKEFSLAIDLDPVSQAVLLDKGFLYYYIREFDQAIELAKKVKELDPDFASSHRLLSLVYTEKGMFREAMEENKLWGTYTGNQIKTEVAMAHIYASAGKKTEALSIAEATDIEERLSCNDYRGIAMVYAALNDIEKTIEWLEKSFQKHEESLCMLKIDPKFNLVRHLPAFKELLRKIGLPVN